MIETSEETQDIDAAILKFQGMVSGVKRDGKNPHFKSNYATLENVADTVRPALQQCGVTFMQSPGAFTQEQCLQVTTRLAHPASGQWLKSTMDIPIGKRDPQGAGSALTYAQRYSLMAMLGLPPTDDDGEAAIDRSEPQKRQVGINPTTGMATAHALKKDNNRPDKPDSWSAFEQELTEATLVTIPKFIDAWAFIMERDKWPATWRETAKEEVSKRRDALRSAQDEDFPGDRPSAADLKNNKYAQAVGGM